MPKTFTATFDGQTLRPDNPVDLKPNERYQVTVTDDAEEVRKDLSAWDTLEHLIGAVVGPSDWAAEHDHYLYSTPKRQATSHG